MYNVNNEVKKYKTMVEYEHFNVFFLNIHFFFFIFLFIIFILESLLSHLLKQLVYTQNQLSQLTTFPMIESSTFHNVNNDNNEIMNGEKKENGEEKIYVY